MLLQQWNRHKAVLTEPSLRVVWLKRMVIYHIYIYSVFLFSQGIFIDSRDQWFLLCSKSDTLEVFCPRTSPRLPSLAVIVFGALEARVSNKPSLRERSIANIRTTIFVIKTEAFQGLPDSFLRAFEMQPQKTLQNLQYKRQSVRAFGGKDAMRSDP